MLHLKVNLCLISFPYEVGSRRNLLKIIRIEIKQSNTFSLPIYYALKLKLNLFRIPLIRSDRTENLSSSKCIFYATKTTKMY